MEARGVNRIVLAVRDIEKAKDIYSRLFGVTFSDASWTGEPFGMNVAISWDAGIELCAPMPGREEGSLISPFLRDHGDGILSVVFGVQDADRAKQRAEQIGMQAIHSVDYSQEEIAAHLGGLFKKYKEYCRNAGNWMGARWHLRWYWEQADFWAAMS